MHQNLRTLLSLNCSVEPNIESQRWAKYWISKINKGKETIIVSKCFTLEILFVSDLGINSFDLHLDWFLQHNKVCLLITPCSLFQTFQLNQNLMMTLSSEDAFSPIHSTCYKLLHVYYYFYQSTKTQCQKNKWFYSFYAYDIWFYIHEHWD